MAGTIEIPAEELEARCLALLEVVAKSGQEFVVTRDGRPLARIVPVEPPENLPGSVVYHGDIISPLEEDWDLNR